MLAPEDGRLLHNTANLLDRLKREDEAVSLWRRAVEVMPNVVEARVGLGIRAGQQSHVEESRRWFRAAFRPSPSTASRAPPWPPPPPPRTLPPSRTCGVT